MARIIEETPEAQGLRIAVVASRYHEKVSERLLEGAVDALARAGAEEDRIEIYKVPGAWELPVVAQRLATTRRYDAIVALGCVIRGGTPHFEYVSAAATQGLARVTLERDIALGLGVLTCDTLQQALDRAGGKQGNKGAEAALSAVEMARLLKRAGKAG